MTSGANLRYRNFSHRAASGGDAEDGAASLRFEEALARARGRARADGFEEGVAQAEAGFDKALAEQLAAIEEAFAAASRDAEALEARIKAEVCAALGAFLKEIAPPLADNGAAAAVVSALSSAMDDAGAVRPVVQIGSSAAETTRAAIMKRAMRVSVETDEALEPGRARIKWRAGFDEVDLRPAIEAALNALSGPPARGAGRQTIRQRSENDT